MPGTFEVVSVWNSVQDRDEDTQREAIARATTRVGAMSSLGSARLECSMRADLRDRLRGTCPTGRFGEEIGLSSSLHYCSERSMR